MENLAIEILQSTVKDFQDKNYQIVQMMQYYVQIINFVMSPNILQMENIYHVKNIAVEKNIRQNFKR